MSIDVDTNSSDILSHYGYQVANYAMEPIRLYVWSVLRAFVAPTFDSLSQKNSLRFKGQESKAQEFAKKLSLVDFEKSSPYFKTKTSEVAFRVLLGAGIIAIPLIGTSVLYLPYVTRIVQIAFACGVFGQTAHSLIGAFSTKNFTAIQDERSKGSQTCSSITSWNVGLVSVFAPLNVGTWESVVSLQWGKVALRTLGFDIPPTRLEKQAEVLRTINSDIVCFQEFFDPLQAKVLHQLVKDDYPNAYLDIAPHIVKGSSGIGVFSKVPIANFQVHDFQVKSKGFDRGTNKKFITFDVIIGNKPTCVYVTHLNCGDYPEIRYAQLQEIVEHMQSNDEEAKPYLLLGDLNFDRTNQDAIDTKYFHEHFSDYFAEDQPITCSDTLKYKYSMSNSIGIESIDYIASKGKLEPTEARVVENNNCFNTSDHLPITVHF